MRIYAHLSGYKKKDGTQTVRIYFYDNGLEKRFNTGINIKANQWNKKSEKVINHELASEFNQKINQLKKLILQGKHKRQEPRSFIKYLDNYIKYSDLKKDTLKVYRSTLRRIQTYLSEKKLNDLNFDDIDHQFYTSYVHWLHSQGTESAAWNHIKVLKRILKMAYEQGVSTNAEYQKSYFRKPRITEKPKIYLNKDEIKSIIAIPDIELREGLQIERDRFLVQYNLILRYGDTRNLSESDFIKREGRLYLKKIHQKTRNEVFVPVNIQCEDILKRYDFKLPSFSNQKANAYLKLIGEKAGIDQLIDGTPKFRFITTHTARRSAATNLLMDGVSPKIIMELGGWTDHKTLDKYLRMSSYEAAKMASKLDFFN